MKILHSSEQQKKLRQAVSHFAEENKLKAVNGEWLTDCNRN